MEKMRRSEKYRLFKDQGVPRQLMLKEEERKREQAFWAVIAFMMLVLALIGKTDSQQVFGMLALFAISLIGVFN